MARLEAVCRKCRETFIPASEDDLIHLQRADGTECGGRGRIVRRATDELFGQRRLRPDHPDFWRLSEILLANDGRIEAARTRDDKERVWREITSDVVNVESVTYMATQRAFKLLGPPTAENIMQHSAVAALFIDAFITGALFERRGGKQ